MAKQAVKSARTKTERHAAKLAAKAATNAFNNAYEDAIIAALGYCLLSTPITSTVGKGVNWLTGRIFGEQNEVQ